MLQALTVLHARKGDGLAGRPEGLPEPDVAESVLELETCQRWLQVRSRRGAGTASPKGLVVDGLERYRGAEAYAFLLRIATGLASELAGETNIFGQFKQAWGPHLHRETWLQCLFEDAKEIRALHLAGVGAPSYGRLVRRALPDGAAHPGRPFLLLGAGELARNVAPWLRHHPLQVWNRTPERAAELARHLGDRAGAPVTALTGSDPGPALADAAAIVACIPFDAKADEARCRALAGRRVPRVIHLGGPRQLAGPWRSLPDLVCLDDLFATQAEEDCDRTRRLLRAARACEERARLRALGKSLSIAHGWEDLATFAPVDAGGLLQAA